MDLSLVDMMMHDSPLLLQPFPGNSFISFLAPYPFESCKFSIRILIFVAKSHRRQYDVIMTSWSSVEEVSKRHHQNFLLCNNNEHLVADLFNSLLWRSARGCICQGNTVSQKNPGPLRYTVSQKNPGPLRYTVSQKTPDRYDQYDITSPIHNVY